MEKEYVELRKLIDKLFDFNLSIFSESYIVKSIQRRLQELNITSISAYTNYVRINNCEGKKLFTLFFNGYSSFFREEIQLAYLTSNVFPNIIEYKESNHEFRIWIAGCSTGQEAYTIGMLLSEYGKLRNKDVKFRIFATDINKDALETAKTGVYSENDVQDIKLKYINNYFNKVKNNYEIKKSLRKQIHFSHFDLYSSSQQFPPESIFGNFDLVICNNVLFYYNETAAHSILDRLVNSISKKGYFVTTDIEKKIAQNRPLITQIAFDSSIFKKHTRELKL